MSDEPALLFGQPDTYTGYRVQIEDACIILCRRDGETTPSAVTVESIVLGLGRDCSLPLRKMLDSRRFRAYVQVAGHIDMMELVNLQTFFTFCQLHPTPRLDAFREKLSRMAVSVQERGSYIDPQAGASRFLTPELQERPTAQMLAALLQHESEIVRLDGTIQNVQNQVADLRDRVGRGPHHWTVAAWLSYHGIKATESVIQQEGLRVRRICQQRGYVVPAEKVNNGGQYPARKWPMEAIRIWWPDFCQRYQIDLSWKVK